MAAKNLLVRGGADFSGVQAAFAGLQGTIKDFQTKFGSSLSKIAADSAKNSARMQSSIGGIGKTVGGIQSTIKSVIRTAAVYFGARQIVSFGKESVNALSELQSAMTGLRSVSDGTGADFQSAQRFIEAFISDGLVPAANAVTAYKNLLARGYDDNQIQQVMTRLKDSAAFGRQASLTYGEAIQSATEGLKNENSILVDNAGVTKNVSKMWQDYAKSIGATVDSLTVQQKIQAEVNGIMEETRFQVGDAAKYANTYAGGVASLSKTFLDLKIAVGGFIQPLAQYVIPYIKTAIKYITALANVISKYVKGALGREEEATENVAVASDTAAVSVENVGDSVEETAKKTERAMGSFDDLDRLVNKTAKDLDASAGTLDELDYGTPSAGESPSLGIDTSGFEASAERLFKKLQPIFELFRAAGRVVGEFYEALFGSNTGGWDMIISFVKRLTGALNGIADWAHKNPGAIQTIAGIILKFLAGMWAFNTAKNIIRFIAGLVSSLVGFVKNVISTVGSIGGKVAGLLPGGGKTGEKEKAGAASGTKKSVANSTKKMFENLKGTAKNLGMGLVIIAEVAAAALLITGAIALLGVLLEQVGKAWEPVIANGATVAIAMGIGTGILAGVGLVAAALGSVGTPLIINIALGAAILAELGIAAGLFLAEMWGIGTLLTKIGEAWKPVLNNGETIAKGITIGTGLLIGIGVVTAALGVATVASVGLLPLAIGLGTAILVQLGWALGEFVDSLVQVAFDLSNELHPALVMLIGTLPSLSVNLERFTTFMQYFAGIVGSYSKSSIMAGFAATVNTIVGWFTKDPIQKLTKDAEKMYKQMVPLREKLFAVLPEMETVRTLLLSYTTLLEDIEVLLGGKTSVKLQDGIFVNFKEVGKNLVTGLHKGVVGEARLFDDIQERFITLWDKIRRHWEDNPIRVKAIASATTLPDIPSTAYMYAGESNGGESGGSSSGTDTWLERIYSRMGEILSRKQNLYLNDEIVGTVSRGQRQNARRYGQ